MTPNGPNQSIARFTTTGLLAGTHSIYAVYGGDANFSPATSSTLPLNLTDYNVIMNPQSITLKAGQTGQVVTLIGSVGGFSGTVSFGCTPPANAEMTCAFSPATLQGGGATTMTIVTTAPQAKPVQQAATGRSGWRLGAGSALAALLCFALPRRRRMMPLLLTSLFALSLLPVSASDSAPPLRRRLPSPTPAHRSERKTSPSLRQALTDANTFSSHLPVSGHDSIICAGC